MNKTVFLVKNNVTQAAYVIGLDGRVGCFLAAADKMRNRPADTEDVTLPGLWPPAVTRKGTCRRPSSRVGRVSARGAAGKLPRAVEMISALMQGVADPRGPDLSGLRKYK